MGSFHFLILLPTLFSLFVHCSPSPIIQAASDPATHSYYNCTRNSTSATDKAYRSNVKTLLDWLSTNSSSNGRYYNTTVSSQNTMDTVYGLFLCVSDIDRQMCHLCVTEAAKLISSLCTTAKEAILWYQVCYVRYSDRRFFSTVETSPEISSMDDKDYVGDVGRFNNILWDMLNDLRRETGNTSAKLANKSVNLTENQKLYGYAWCLPYLSAENCSWCLSDAIAGVPTNCCRGKSGGSISYPSCGVRFELYPFHKAHSNIPWVLPSPTSPSPSAPPAAIDTPTHAYYNCTRNSTSATDNTYHSNIKTLLDWLSSNSSNNARYYNTTVASQNTMDTVYGLFHCISDIDLKICQSCVIEAAKLISSLCTTAKEAIIWYKACCVHYSDHLFFSTVEKSPEISFMNDKDYVGDIGSFNNILWDMLNDMRRETGNSSAKLASKSVNLTENQKLYGYAFCLPYLSAENCSWCLSDAIAEVPTSCCRGKSGGTILYPSCGVRFELYPFNKAHKNVTWVLPPPTSPSPSAPPVSIREEDM
ncbi:hypothetical protein TSUD_47100 [Trifolium subterraneum]|nr:hypothetical protein TSUD_47100 [Trifolium subterraneum]